MTKNRVYKEKENPLIKIFNKNKVIIAVVHCQPLPGSPDYQGERIDEIINNATEDAIKYKKAGVDGIIVENHGDIPFLKPEKIGPETPAVMAILTKEIQKSTGLPVGVNILANAAKPAIAVAKATNSQFIRINEWVNAYVANEGIIEGKAAEIMRYRSWLHARNIKIFADVHVKHGSHAIVADRSIPELTRDAEFFDADGVIVTGYRTGNAPTKEEIMEIRKSTQLPLLAGSGVTIDNLDYILENVDGIIVASSLKHEGVWWNPVDQNRALTFMKKVRELR